jgi:diketogulonate reductase-like aldo/keto reductase
MSILNSHFILSNSIKMPSLGIGTYKLKNGDEAYHAVLYALSIGVRHIDSAIIYQNEQSVGLAIKDSKIPREEIFVTSKLPPHIKNYQGALRMFEKTLSNLGLDYLDAYIINAPGPFHDIDGNYDEGNVEAYRALEKLYEDERVTAIGVSQFKIKDIENIINHCRIVPHIQQISYFIGHTQKELVDFCQKYKIQVQAFSPLAKGYLLNHPTVIEFSRKYQVSPSQIALRYIIQKGVAPIPKAAQSNHIELNTKLDFALNTVDMLVLDQIIDDPRVYDDL